MNPPPLTDAYILPRKRPDLVTLLFILFCIFAPIAYVTHGLALLAVATGRAESSLGVVLVPAILAIVIRAVGMVRLFLMKSDAWIYLALALVIGLPASLLPIIGDHLDGKDIAPGVLGLMIGLIIALSLVGYAYRLFHCTSEEAE